MTGELPLRDKDLTVLHCIREGKDDIQEITSTTTLKNHHVNYCFTKLEEQGLITINRPEGYTTRNIDGQERTFRRPKRAALTTRGQDVLYQYLENYENAYPRLTQEEITERLLATEKRIGELQTNIETMRDQIQRVLGT